MVPIGLEPLINVHCGVTIDPSEVTSQNIVTSLAPSTADTKGFDPSTATGYVCVTFSDCPKVCSNSSAREAKKSKCSHETDHSKVVYHR